MSVAFFLLDQCFDTRASNGVPPAVGSSSGQLQVSSTTSSQTQPQARGEDKAQESLNPYWGRLWGKIYLSFVPNAHHGPA